MNFLSSGLFLNSAPQIDKNKFTMNMELRPSLYYNLLDHNTKKSMLLLLDKQQIFSFSETQTFEKRRQICLVPNSVPLNGFASRDTGFRLGEKEKALSALPSSRNFLIPPSPAGFVSNHFFHSWVKAQPQLS